MILGVAFLLRLYRVFVGGPHARQIFYIPFWSLHWWKEMFGEVRWYLFIGKPKEYVGHNPLAHLAMFLMFLLPTIVLLLTGFALYAEGAGVQSGWYKAFGWVFTVIGNSFAGAHLAPRGDVDRHDLLDRPHVHGDPRGHDAPPDDDQLDDQRLEVLPLTGLQAVRQSLAGPADDRPRSLVKPPVPLMLLDANIVPAAAPGERQARRDREQ